MLSIIVSYKIKGEKPDGLEKFSQSTWNGKVYNTKNDFIMNWLLVSNESKENEWSATNIGQDHFTKV